MSNRPPQTINATTTDGDTHIHVYIHTSPQNNATHSNTHPQKHDNTHIPIYYIQTHNDQPNAAPIKPTTGIAQVTAEKGYRVLLKDKDLAGVARGQGYIKDNLQVK